MAHAHAPVKRVAVVGAGFSGTLAAIRIARAATDLSIYLFERSPPFGRGLAYATVDPGHLLNVRADRMSAFPEDPFHFERWLRDHGGWTGGDGDEAGVFVSRGLYGRYLSWCLTEAVTEPGIRLAVAPDGVAAITPDGDRFQIESELGRRYGADAVVLAVGNLSTPVPLKGGAQAVSPWAPEAFAGLSPDEPVLILGTALTMADTVISLHRAGFEGPVVAVSRRGLAPLVHAPVAHQAGHGDERLPACLSGLFAHVRRDADRRGWREAVDALRPHVQQIWQGFDDAERRRFLRHVRTFWDIHRHRLAPRTGARIAEMRETGRLSIRAGRVIEAAPEGGRVRAVIRRRGGGEERLLVQRVFDATGYGPLGDCREPLMRQLLDAGLAGLDPLGLGLDVDDSLRVRGPVRHVYALGPLTRGAFWECTAVPDIRVQARTLAATVCRDLHEKVAVPA